MTQVLWAAVLAAAAVLTNADAFFVTDSKLSLRSDPSDVYFNRFLSVNDEERAGVYFSIVEKAKHLWQPSVSAQQLSKWVTIGKPAKDVFVRLGLTRVGEKLFETPQFFTWAKYVDNSAGTSKAPAMIPILRAQYGDDALARMIAAAKTTGNADVKKLATRLEREQLYAWAAKGKSPDQAFTFFKLNKAGDDLLSSPQLTTLEDYLGIFNSKNPDKKTTLIATMVKSYGDDSVAKILQAGMKVPGTAADARRLDTELVELWLANGKSTDDVFKLLNLDKAGDKLFSNPLLVTWTKYMNAFNEKNPSSPASLTATLAAHYGDNGVAAMLKSQDVHNILAKIKPEETLFDNPHFLLWVQFVDDPRKTRMATSLMTSLTVKFGDEALIKMIEAAKKVSQTKDVATKLETQQFQYWAAIRKHPDNVFKLYALDKAGDDLLSNPLLATWSAYLNVFNKQHAKEQTTLIAAMTKSYGDEGVVKILEAAKKVPDTAKTAKMLESKQLQRWLRTDPDDVFKLLRLDTAGEKMFNSLSLNAWGKYVSAFNADNPEKKTNLIATMTTHYGDEGVIGLLEAAKKVPGSEAIATRLQREQLQYWLSIGKEPKYVFKLFKLDKAEDKLLDSPQFSTWAKYLDDFFKNGDMDVAAFKSMRSYYNDEELATMILAAEKNPSTKKIAHWTEESLFKGWMARMTPGEVFRGLHLEKTKDKVFETPLFGYFQKYMDRKTEGMRDKDSVMISAMTSGFGDEALASVLIAAKEVPSTEKLATKLQAGQIQLWLAHKQNTPEHVFKKVLFLDDSVDDILTNPLLNTWASYLEAFNAKRPLSERESMVGIFRASFSDEELVTMLIAAKEVPSTKKMATDLEAALLNQWVTDREPPAAVSKILTSGGVEDSTKAKLLETYSAKFKEKYGGMSISEVTR
ncbi:Avirulence (Avh) protein [Phytophthora cinnamomi]|uniref:Avirulence (Avh) protein n=1 Tax=Phytophthora cinnamomi TaxID=4785 RepID=UPI003559DDF9|nr:Avirulence (Avh) protein [Phytophthora cinnamomi]